MLAETPVTQRSPCYSAVSSSLTNPLPDCSHFAHTHYLILRINTSLVSTGQTLYQAAQLETNTSLLQRFTAEPICWELRSALRKLNNKQRQVLMFLLVPFNCHLSSLLSLFSLSPSSLCSHCQSSLCSLCQSSLCSLCQSSLFSLPHFPQSFKEWDPLLVTARKS